MSDPTGKKLDAHGRSAPPSELFPDEVPSGAVMVEGQLAAPRTRSAYEVGGIDVEQLALALAERLKPPEPEKPFFGELAHEWMESIRSKRVAPENEERHLRRLTPLFLETEETLTAAMISNLLDAQEDLSASTRNKLRGTGRLIVDYAQARQVWNRPNPFALVKREKEGRRKYELLTLEELARVQPHLRVDRLRLFRVALHTGMRPGELMGLRAEDLDFPSGIIHVRRSRERDETKTGEPREIPLPAAIVTDLLDAVDASKSELVFAAEDGDMEKQTTKLSRILRTAMKKARVGLTGWKLACRRPGCEFVEVVKMLDARARPRCPRCDFKLWREPQVRDVRWYDLRHMCATLHHDAGANDLCISIALGHAIPEETTTKKTYVHPSMAKLAAELSKWELPRPKVLSTETRRKKRCQAELLLTCDESTR